MEGPKLKDELLTAMEGPNLKDELLITMEGPKLKNQLLTAMEGPKLKDAERVPFIICWACTELCSRHKRQTLTR